MCNELFDTTENYIHFNFKDDKDIPKESPIGSKDRNEIQNKIGELENQKNEIQSEIEKLLREQASS